MEQYQSKREKKIIIAGSSEVVPNIFELEKIGAGHDGYIFRFNDRVLKLLKYDINLRKERNLMTFDKAEFFRNNLDLERVTQPIDFLLDEDGIYSGYVMNYIEDLTSARKEGTPRYRQPGDFSCGDLISSTEILQSDFSKMSSKDIVVNDINSGSYIFASDFMHLCDMDKYYLGKNANDLNKQRLNFVIAKFLYMEMVKTGDFSKEDKKLLNRWVAKQSNSRSFLSEVRSDIGTNYSASISDYVGEKAKTLIR